MAFYSIVLSIRRYSRDRKGKEALFIESDTSIYAIWLMPPGKPVFSLSVRYKVASQADSSLILILQALRHPCISEKRVLYS